MRIAIADDGALFRDGLRLLLQAAGHEVVHTAGGGDELTELIRADPVDIAVLDIRMPPEPDGGLVTAGRLRASYPSMGLLLLSHYAETHYLVRIMEIGPAAIGYRLKDRISSVPALDDTLLRIAAGEVVIDPALTTRLVEYTRLQRGELGALTSHDVRVLSLMAAGLSNAGIAGELGVSRKAVEKQVGAIFAKLDLPDSASDNRRVLAVLRYLEPHGSNRPARRTGPGY
ncbi:response regulator transcription factor [Micromonospora craniellae]|uniref:response regulator transcription factor n=1 Tax=Micromonospora craniellae TaxID=2294034 RepID=UPI0018F17C63|nr:response regulator transcription factor [Micromonospora craniellae]